MTASNQYRAGLWITLGVALVYCIWLGGHWLPLDYSDKELAASASRVWDVKHELSEHGRIPWWTPNFMSGSSYGLNHSRGFYLLPWLLFSTFTDLQHAGKLVALAAIFASAVAMFFCVRYFLAPHPDFLPAGAERGTRKTPARPLAGRVGGRGEWAAVLAAIVYLLHPEQIIRAAGAEHITICLFFPFVPLLWWTFARMLDTGKFRDVFLCALTGAFALWTDTKQAAIHFVFLALYLGYRLWRASREHGLWQAQLRSLGVLAVLGMALAAVIILPGALESRYVKLFTGDPLRGWQQNYAFRSLFSLVDRDGVVTHATVQSVANRIQTQGGFCSQAEFDAWQQVLGLQMESPDKYAGIIVLALIAVAVLWNRARADRLLFWFFVALLLLSVMLASGLRTVAGANWLTYETLSRLDAMPVAGWLALLVAVAFLVVFGKKKLTSPKKWLMAGGALLIFLFVPAFVLVSQLPYFKDIRAPYTFYDGPAVFFTAMLAGFFVTDVLGGGLGATRHTNDTEGCGTSPRRVPWIVAGLAVLILVDFWPYQKPAKENNAPARTLANLRATYAALRTDPDWVKTYSLSGRYFHLLGPMHSGKPQVYEAFYNWMAPLGTGLLNQHAGPELFNLIGARYLVFDKSDRQTDQRLAVRLRQEYPVALENEDFVVFRNNNARAYVTGYARACAYVGDVKESATLALKLSAQQWPLIEWNGAGDSNRFEVVYREGMPIVSPKRTGQPVSFSDVQLTREHAGLIRIRLTAPSSCLAVVAESWFPYWRGEVDGRPSQVQRVSCGLMGVELPAGSHEIVLRYHPPRSYAAAGLISLICLVAGFVATIRSCRAGRS